MILNAASFDVYAWGAHRLPESHCSYISVHSSSLSLSVLILVFAKKYEKSDYFSLKCRVRSGAKPLVAFSAYSGSFWPSLVWSRLV